MKKLTKIAIVSTIVAAASVGLGGFLVAGQANETAVATNESATTAQATGDSKAPGFEQDWYYGRGYARPVAYRGYWGPRAYWGRPAYYPRRYYWYYW